MKMRYINSIVALCIGLAPVAYGTENNLPEAQAQVQTIDVQPVAQTVPAGDQKPVDATVQDAQKAPILVPFDLELYKLHCGSKKSVYGWNAFTKAVSLAFGAVGIATVLGSFVNDPMSFALITSKGVSDWYYNNRWYWMIALAIYNPLYKASKIAAFAGLVYNTYTSATTLESDATNFFLWEEREDLFNAIDKNKAVLEMRSIWHEEVYARLGRPTIIGEIPVVEKYKIKGIRNGVEMIFDPFNREHVRALLGFNPNENCWRFEKVEIIPV